MIYEPLFMPQGSVRALLAFSILACTIILVINTSSYSTEFITMTSLVIGYYFGTRTRK